MTVDVRTIDRQRFEAVMRLLADHPELDVDGLRGLVDGSSGPRRSRREMICPRTVAELVSLVQAGLVTKAEAKRYVDVPKARVRRGA